MATPVVTVLMALVEHRLYVMKLLLIHGHGQLKRVCGEGINDRVRLECLRIDSLLWI